VYEFHQYVPLEFSKSGESGHNSGIEKSVYGGGKHNLYLNINL
jgi:hypothetical protein